MAEFTKAADRDVLERVIYLAKSKGTVYTLLGKVSEQSGFLFVYDSKVVDNDRMVPACRRSSPASPSAPEIGRAHV